ncbi:hypothetical protein [Stieleria marina]|uniref:Uncharacterized protein n=1 Tax=Stieleria marina TaxID=1930275 RepID=A0A517NLV1_9BACT|nr:hypothetical protein K239x_00340 [Planctomycetes bacterium K23_9]
MFFPKRKRSRKRDSGKRPDAIIDEIRQQIAANLGMDPCDIRYGNLGRCGKLGTTDPHWLVFYRGQWRELPWHFDGPLLVTRQHISQWYD